MVYHFLDFFSDSAAGNGIQIEVDAVVDLTTQLVHWKAVYHENVSPGHQWLDAS